MAENIQLDNPELEVQHERGRFDPYLRNFITLKRYAHVNGFDDRLDEILRHSGAGELADIQYGENGLPQEVDVPKLRDLLPKLARAVDVAQVSLRDEIKRGRKGVEPFLKTIRYRFVDKDGRKINFDLDPDANANRTLHDFEDLIEDLPNPEEVESQFMPTFRQIRRDMESWGWDKEAAGPQATLLTIKQLCDLWSEHSSE